MEVSCCGIFPKPSRQYSKRQTRGEEIEKCLDGGLEPTYYFSIFRSNNSTLISQEVHIKLCIETLATTIESIFWHIYACCVQVSKTVSLNRRKKNLAFFVAQQYIHHCWPGIIVETSLKKITFSQKQSPFYLSPTHIGLRKWCPSVDSTLAGCPVLTHWC